MKKYHNHFWMKCFLMLAFFKMDISLIARTENFTPSVKDYSQALFTQYDHYKESSITQRRFKHKDILPLIENLPFDKQVVAQSFENRDIYQIKLGTGKIKLLLWSQMHGDESTATMAIFDIFKFFQAKNDGFDDLRKQILEKCTLYFVPMLNPDGAERFQRRTATEIDMNRDALRLQTPEGVLLKHLQNTLMPDFAFNLHDQGSRTSAGNSPKQATISFLATAYKTEREWNKVRKRSMQVICSFFTVIAHNVSRCGGKYDSAFFINGGTPRAMQHHLINFVGWKSGCRVFFHFRHNDDCFSRFAVFWCFFTG